jgi:hypothetical protein
LNSSAERKSSGNDKVSRRLELVREVRVVPEKANRRFRIGLADNVFTKTARCSEMSDGRDDRNSKPQVEAAPPQISPVDNDETTRFISAELMIGVSAVLGLTLGYLIGKHRK